MNASLDWSVEPCPGVWLSEGDATSAVGHPMDLPLELGPQMTELRNLRMRRTATYASSSPINAPARFKDQGRARYELVTSTKAGGAAALALVRPASESQAHCGMPASSRTHFLLKVRHARQRKCARMTVEPLHDAPPRETVGRETALRFRMQYQAAAYAALEILHGSGVDRVYCDYHDDFVVRHSSEGEPSYHFFQVKTKAKLSQQWTLVEVFALKKTSALDTEAKLQDIRDSIA